MSKQQFFSVQDIDIKQFQSICDQKLNRTDLSFSSEIIDNVPIFDGTDLLDVYFKKIHLNELKSELNYVLEKLSGVVVIKGFFLEKQVDVIDESNKYFLKVISDEKKIYTENRDFFSAKGKTDKLRNAYEKLCLNKPDTFFVYYSNPLFNLMYESWLGEYYQITSQISVVNPGGMAQISHRDYHLGVQAPKIISKFPLNIQKISQFLTLQGVVAHCDMPIESGPTRLLPFSQNYELGYLSFRDEQFIKYFDEYSIQIPLEKGDAIFLNPALYHAAGENRTNDIKRIANLIQTSCAFGKPVEKINQKDLIKKIYKILLENKGGAQLDTFIRNTTNGYPFPTCLDKNPPLNGRLSLSWRDVILENLAQNVDAQSFNLSVDKEYSEIVN